MLTEFTLGIIMITHQWCKVDLNNSIYLHSFHLCAEFQIIGKALKTNAIIKLIVKIIGKALKTNVFVKLIVKIIGKALKTNTIILILLTDCFFQYFLAKLFSQGQLYYFKNARKGSLVSPFSNSTAYLIFCIKTYLSQ